MDPITKPREPAPLVTSVPAPMLTKWRKDMGYSQREASEQLGCSRNAWQAWEHGDTRCPRYIGLAMAALATGMTPYGSGVSSEKEEGQ